MGKPAGDDLDGPDALRLTFCPACDYGLAGLPDLGNCPECGRPYDTANSVVILRGYRPLVGGGPWLVIYLAIAALSAYIAAMLVKGFGGAYRSVGVDPWLLAGELAGSLLVTVAIRQYARMVIPWPNPYLLWVTPSGLGVQSTIPAGSLTSIVVALPRQLIYAATLLIAYGIASSQLHSRRAALIITAGLPLVTLAVSGLMLWAIQGSVPRPLRVVRQIWQYRSRLRRTPLGQRPPVFGWSALGKITLRPTRRGRWRLTAGQRKRWLAPLIRLDLELPPGDADALTRRITAWSDNAGFPDVTTKRSQ